MSMVQSVIMGLIQGLTEFLPVSSSGHLALFKILFNVNTDTEVPERFPLQWFPDRLQPQDHRKDG